MGFVTCENCGGAGCESCDHDGFFLEFPEPILAAPLVLVSSEAVTQAIASLQAITPKDAAEREAHKQLFVWLDGLRKSTESGSQST